MAIGKKRAARPRVQQVELPQLIVPIGHSSTINAIDISVDNELILSSCNDRTVKLWNKDGLLLDTISFEFVPTQVSFSNSGDLFFVIGEDADVHIFQTKNRNVYRDESFSPKPFQVLALDSFPEKVMFSADDTKILALSNAQQSVSGEHEPFPTLSIITIDSKDQEKISIEKCKNFSFIFPAKEDEVEVFDHTIQSSFKIDLNTRKVEQRDEEVLASNDPIIALYIWAEGNKKLLFQYNQKKKLVGYATQTGTEGIINLDLSTLSLLESTVSIKAFGNKVFAVFPANQKIIAWDGHTFDLAREIIPLDFVPTFSVLSKDCRFLACFSNTSNSNYITILDLPYLPAKKGKVLKGSSELIQDHKLSQDGKRLFVLAHSQSDQHISVKVAELISPLSVKTYQGRNAIAISPQGDILAFGWDQNTIQIRNLNHHADSMITFAHNDNPSSIEVELLKIAISPDRNSILVGYLESSSSQNRIIIQPIDLQYFNTQNTPLKQENHFESHTVAVTIEEVPNLDISYSKDGQRVLVVTKDQIQIFHRPTQSSDIEHKYFEPNKRVIIDSKGLKCAVFSPTDTNQVMTGGAIPGQNAEQAILWNIETKEQIRSFRLEERQSSLDTNGNPIHTRGKIESLSYSLDETKLISGHYKTGFRVWNIEQGVQHGKFEQHDIGLDHYNPVTSIIPTVPQHIFISTAGDSRIQIWKGQELLGTLFFLEGDSPTEEHRLVEEDNWAVITPDGLFEASPGAMAMMHYVIGLDIIELEQMKHRYWRPGLLAAILNPHDSEVRDIQKLKEVPLYPNLKSINIVKDSLEIEIEERNGGIGRTSLRINNKEQDADINPYRKTLFKFSLKDYQKFFELGDNTISVRCWNEEDWLPGPHYEITYTKEKDQETVAPSSLFSICIGTSKYRNPDLKLNFPDQDATFMHDALQVIGAHLFKDRVFTTLLTSEANLSNNLSNKKNIKEAFKEVATRAKPQDVVVIYLSGHGANHGDGRNALYYYLTYSIVNSNLSDSVIRKENTLSSEELTNWINAIPARKQVLILDTCFSGKVIEDLNIKNAIDATRQRAMERMKDRTGMFVLAGSASDKVSYEASSYGQGLLTYTLLEGMRGPALFERKNQPEKSVDVLKLFYYSREEVERLSREFLVNQRPTLRIPKKVESFDIGIAPIAARRQIKIATPKPIFKRSNFMNSVNFLDDLGLSTLLNQYLAGTIGIGHRPKAVFIDVGYYPGAHQIRGLYEFKEELNSYEVNGIIYKDEVALGTIEVNGKDVSELIPEMARQIEEIVFPSYQVPDDDEVGAEEKGRKEDLIALKKEDKPEFGYREAFIGPTFQVPLPDLSPEQQKDVASTSAEFGREPVLKYRYYSVVQSKSRKFPYYAACNLHGGQFLKLDRSGTFIRDPRLAKEDQWGDEFYTSYVLGTDGKPKVDENNKRIKYSDIFHRGHMAKREDAQWGPTAEIALSGAKLTFFFTNAIPQHGRLNSVVWRGLEDYIMDVATNGKTATGDEGYKINIFTGPVFQEDDPELDIQVGQNKTEQIKIPVLFWKIVYYRKRTDNKLRHVGFMMGQKELIKEAFEHYKISTKGLEDKKPFENYKNKEVFQVPVSLIERQTQLSFQDAFDPMEGAVKGQQIEEKLLQLEAKDIYSSKTKSTYELRGLEL